VGRKKAHTPEEIVAKLRQAEVLVSQGKMVADAVRAIGVTEPTYYRWRTEFGGLKLDHPMTRRGQVSRIHRTKPPGRPIAARTRRPNTLKSAMRSAVEHVFARKSPRRGWNSNAS